MLASLATPHAKPAEGQLKTLEENSLKITSFQNNEDEKSLPLKHRVSKRHDNGGRKRRGFARWDIPQNE